MNHLYLTNITPSLSASCLGKTYKTASASTGILHIKHLLISIKTFGDQGFS